MKKLAELKEGVERWRGFDGQAESVDELLALALEEKDDSLFDTFVDEVAQITHELDTQEFKLVLLRGV